MVCNYVSKLNALIFCVHVLTPCVLLHLGLAFYYLFTLDWIILTPLVRKN